MVMAEVGPGQGDQQKAARHFGGRQVPVGTHFLWPRELLAKPQRRQKVAWVDFAIAAYFRAVL